MGFFEASVMVDELVENARDRQFRKELETVINRYSKESGSDTPDFILAEYLVGCLEVFDKTVKSRAVWYSNDGAVDPPEDDG